jgi:hypothetical protein
MGITGLWAERRGIQAGANRWGSGVNPIHGQRYPQYGRGTAPGGSEPVHQELTDTEEDTYGYTPEDSVPWGHGVATGTSLRPRLGENDRRNSTQVPSDFPEWGPYRAGRPGGTQIRSLDRGGDLTHLSRMSYGETATAGWDNKLHGDEGLAEVSAPSQYVMQTSMVQRNKVREGSQTPSGRASQYMAPIQSRLIGMKSKPMTGDPTRHNAMEPREQTFTIRPWWSRNAGTGPTGYLKSNDAYTSTPLTRNPPSDPYQGPILAGDSGYTDEDPYYG